MKTSRTTVGRPLLLLALLALLAPWASTTGCSDDDGGTDAGPDADVPTDEGPDGDGDGACVPRTCMDIDRACGTYDDECGGTIECLRGCACTPENYAATCPERPCETLVGCTDHVCSYEPVSCGAAACDCRAADCEDWTLRSCGTGVCTAQYCDPRPTSDGTTVHYENACVAAPAVGACGVCGLGRLECDVVSDTFQCIDLPVEGVDPTLIECDSTLPTSSFVFVDPDYTGGDGDGSRSRPYQSYADGVSAAWGRDAVGVILAGSHVTRGSPLFMEGVSVYGGFDGAPYFRVSDARPTWEVGLAELSADDRAARLLVGARLRGFFEPTVLSHLGLRTDSAADEPLDGAGFSNYGLLIQDSPGVRLIDLLVVAGDAGDGEPGAAGDAGPAGAPGGAGEAATRCDTPGDDVRTWNSSTGTWDITRDERVCEGAVHAGGTAAGTTRCLDFVSPPETAGGAGGRAFFDSTCDFPMISGTSDGTASPGGATGGTGSWTWHNPGESGASASSTPPVQAEPGELPDEPMDFGGELRLVASPTGDGGRGAGGTHGQGGGGGASGGSSYTSLDYRDMYAYDWWDSPALIIGGGGGGGGGGGCGGGAAEGGRGGGVSVALFVARSDGLVLDGGSYTSGAAGDGGPGGAGGLAGPGGLGGAGGPLTSAMCTEWGTWPCEWITAGGGGHGGSGQPGADGGNAIGGSSYGGYCFDSLVEQWRPASFASGSAGLGASFGIRPAPDGLAADQFGCVRACGNGVREPGEPCDDGNREDGDGCESDCTLVCGDDLGATRASRDAAGHCLAGFDEPLDWEDAELACIAAGGHLASIDLEPDFLAANLMFDGLGYWLGLNDRTTEGTYVWAGGAAPTWTAGYCAGEPRDDETNDCMMSFWSSGWERHCWLVRACDVPLPYLCEIR